MSSSPGPTFAADLVAALAEMTNPPKAETATVRSEKGSYSYTYADLPAVLDHVRPILARHGLALLQEAFTDLTSPGFVGVNTRLVHISGEQMNAGPLLLSAGPNAQTAGSALTYAARYAVCRLLGIAGADEDDDATTAREGSSTRSTPGRMAARHEAGPSPRPSGPPTSDAPASDQEYREGEGLTRDEVRASLGTSDPNPPVLPIGGGAPDWKAISQRLAKAWERVVSMTDAKQAIVAELRSQDIAVTKPSEVNEDLALHALRELERNVP